MKNNVLASVNGKNITESDIENIIKSLGQQRASQFQGEKGKKILLNEVVKQELMFLDAKDSNLENDEEYKYQLEKLKDNLLKEYSVSKLLQSVKVEDSEIVDFYNKNKAHFTTGESVKASHILVEDEEKANNILEEINNDVSFEDAAMKHSICPSNTNGGDLGFFTKGKMVKEFEEAAFSMKLDEISKPVKTQFGYHIIKLTERKPAQIHSLDEVKDSIVQQLTGQKQNEVYNNKANSLMSKYEVKFF